jgi:hypothetical protein
MDWVGLAQGRDRWSWGVVNAVMNLRVPWNAEDFLTLWGPVSFSERALLHGVSYELAIVFFLDNLWAWEDQIEFFYALQVQ